MPDPGDNLFTSAAEERFDAFAPLAARMRPRTLDEVVGQTHLVGPGGPLRRLIAADRLGSIVLWGPAGTGKTSIATIVASATKGRFVTLSAVTGTVADVRKAIAEAREALGAFQRKTILFIDEIHRFNKAQQDALLPAVERGEVVLIGATTENPYFSVNAPLLSRSLVFRLEPLTREEVRKLLHQALQDKERGLGAGQVDVTSDALDYVVDRAGGDARTALNALEAMVAGALATGARTVTETQAAEALQQPLIRYDRAGDAHYDAISAFIKSLRGSDPDAALWWMAGMLEAGEDPRFIARRMVILASEDIGNADPTALLVAVAAFQALEFVGLPEARLNLAQAAIHLAMAPKSNASYLAIGRATDDVKRMGAGEVPPHLRGTGYPGAKKLGHGVAYQYPHDFPGGWVAQTYLPTTLAQQGGPRYYEPTDRGAEAGAAEVLAERRKARLAHQHQENRAPDDFR
ncbi:MAG TPA: replication-associated recombination protein A [Actinomycetota bacterium]|nr:replication-associated recombination protein A [Actinomycetota bacterium]